MFSFNLVARVILNDKSQMILKLVALKLSRQEDILSYSYTHN